MPSLTIILDAEQIRLIKLWEKLRDQPASRRALSEAIARIIEAASEYELRQDAARAGAVCYLEGWIKEFSGEQSDKKILE